MNKKGSILHIVLIVFIILTTTLTLATSLIIHISESQRDINLMMKQKNLEILLLRYYIDSMKNDILLSDDIETNEYEVSYVVDDMGNYSLIETYIDLKQCQYRWIVEITNNTFEVQKLEYMEV